jgi:2-polyprenyl-3-methyl-5-hydroxy-6-metoxy-1,4-benzoquinol methylase
MTDAISLQQSFWNKWNSNHREHSLQDISIRQADVVCGWLEAIGHTDLDILEVGCGAGWFCPRLAQFGRTTGTDLSDQVLARASKRFPQVSYVSGDFMELEFGDAKFDVLVALEVLSHVADQPAFIEKLARHLRPGGALMLATQNRPVLQKFNRIPPPEPGQLRRWVDKYELRQLLEPHFKIRELFSVSPRANRGLMRLVNSYKLNCILRALFGNKVERLKERLGLGWTLMVWAQKS